VICIPGLHDPGLLDHHADAGRQILLAASGRLLASRYGS
jgi:hypothetical protein